METVVEFCMGLVHCSRSRPVPTAVIPVQVPQWSILLPSSCSSFQSRPSPVAFTAAPVPVMVPVPLKRVGEKNEIENFIQTVHITR